LDNPDAGLWLLLILLFILANGFFVFSETAITESHKSRLEKLADDGNMDARQTLKILDKPENILSVVQIGITFISILIGSLTGALIAPCTAQLIDFLPYSSTIALVGSILFITYINLLFGEFLPKKIALENPEAFLMHRYMTLMHLEKLTRPCVSFLSASANAILLLFGISPHVPDSVTEDEVKDLIEQGTEEGTFEKTEQDMVDRIFHMSDQTAYSLMTPRTQMLWLDLEDSLAHNLKLIQENADTIFPVGKDNLDDFCGVLYTKDLLNAAIGKTPLELSQYIRKPMFIPRSMETFRVLEKFQATGIHEAVVLDEYGGVIGFITLSDIIQEIIGDTVTSSEPEPIQITLRDENSWYVDGLYSIDDFKEKFSIDDLPDEARAQYQTMGGFLTSYFGYIPKVAEKCQWGDFSFEIVDMDRARIDKILITRRNADEKNASFVQEQTKEDTP
jgi:putative hemolysin